MRERDAGRGAVDGLGGCMVDLAGLRRTVALACRILAYRGLAEDVLGHVSVRVGADRMLVRCRGPQGLPAEREVVGGYGHQMPSIQMAMSAIRR